MSFRNWLEILKSLAPLGRSRKTSPCRKRPRPALSLERLEERDVPAFLAPVGYDVGASPQAIVAAYFNNDSILDLAVANTNGSTVSILLGNPDAPGTFLAASTINLAANSYPVSIAVGDLDGDTKADDIAVANSGTNDITVLKHNDDDTFTSLGNFGTGYSPTSVAVGDFDGDGNLDLGAASNNYIPYYYGYWGWYPGYWESYANVLIGNGSGSFSGPYTSWMGYGYHLSAAVGNFNGDAFDDFATVNYEYGTVSVLAGDISGYLQWPADYYVGAYPYAVAAGDLNGDLKDDLVTANIGDRTASVLLNNGSGGFGSATNYEVGDSPASVVLADFTHDGKLDLATANAGSDDVTVLRGNGSGAFAFVSNSAANDNPWAITAADFNGDTWQDVAVANPGINKASVLMNTTDWRSFQVAGHPSPSIIGETHEITVSALDNDGNPLTSYTGTIHFDSSDLIADLPPDYTFLPTDGGTKTFFVTLNTVGSQSITVNDMATTAIMGRQSAIVVNPPPPATFSIDNVSVLEGDGAAVAAEFTITRGGNMATTVTVNYSTANGGALAGSDYVAGGALLTFGPNETTKKVIIQVNGDLMDEFDQSFYVNLWGAGVGGSIIDSQGVGTIMDNDPPPVINITPLVSKSEGKKNGLTTFDFLVTLSSPSEKTITVNFATATGTASSDDYIANSNSLTFWPGDTSKTITVMVRGDQRKEPTETFFVNLSNANNATLGTLQGIGEILDDDPTPRGPKNR